MSHVDGIIRGMKVLTCLSAVMLFVSVGLLDSAGAWWLVALGASAFSLGALWLSAGKLGYF